LDSYSQTYKHHKWGSHALRIKYEAEKFYPNCW
jgi:hypothetical protein